MKTCVECQQQKKLTEFGKNSRKKDGLQSYCRSCFNEKVKTWYKNNPSVPLERSYGISIETFNKLLDQQNEVCATCGKPCVVRQRLSVDHNHVTGEIRGLLCYFCNLILGLSHENPEVLLNLVDYLKKFSLVKAS